MEIYGDYFSEIRNLCGVTDTQLMKYCIYSSFDPGLNSESLEKHAGNKGGQSGAFLYVSFDHRFIIKTLKSSEKEVLGKLLPDLRDHLVDLQGQSCLARIYGVYSVQRTAKDTFYILLMECLLPSGLDAVYDLKGSTAGRRALKDPNIIHIEEIPKGVICKDLDFLQTLRVFELPQADFLNLRTILESDLKLLSKHRLMDYSLLVGVTKNKRLVVGYEHSSIVCNNGLILYLGIIDYLQSYSYRKRLENWGLEIRGKKKPSCVHPDKYSRRFFAFIISIILPSFCP